MSKPYPCGGMGRRQFLAGGAAVPLIGAFATAGAAPDEPPKAGKSWASPARTPAG